jgi:hypothetical protein
MKMIRIRVIDDNTIVDVEEIHVSKSLYLSATHSYMKMEGKKEIDIEGYASFTVLNYISYLRGGSFTMDEDVDKDFFSLMGEVDEWSYPLDYWKTILEDRRILRSGSEDPLYGMEPFGEEVQFTCGSLPQGTILLGKGLHTVISGTVHPTVTVCIAREKILTVPFGRGIAAHTSNGKVHIAISDITRHLPYIYVHSCGIDCDGIVGIFNNDRIQLYATKRAIRSIEKKEVWLSGKTSLGDLGRSVNDGYRVKTTCIDPSTLDFIDTISKGLAVRKYKIDPTSLSIEKNGQYMAACILSSDPNIDPGSILILLSIFGVRPGLHESKIFHSKDQALKYVNDSPLVKKIKA